MHLLRVIPLIVALLVQALPATAVALDVQPKCDMTCCAERVMPCCCAESEQAPVPAPMSTLPATVRDIIPMTWRVFTAVFPWKIYYAEPAAGFDTCVVVTQPHVRLPVLFRSILI